jgi:hypothetical protein
MLKNLAEGQPALSTGVIEQGSVRRLPLLAQLA